VLRDGLDEANLVYLSHQELTDQLPKQIYLVDDSSR
jgi:hypothetical protein